MWVWVWVWVWVWADKKEREQERPKGINKVLESIRLKNCVRLATKIERERGKEGEMMKLRGGDGNELQQDFRWNKKKSSQVSEDSFEKQLFHRKRHCNGGEQNLESLFF